MQTLEYESFASLIRATQDRVLQRIGRRLSSELSRQVDVEDILQQACLSAWQHFDHKAGWQPRAFAAWILRFAEHEILNASRRRSMNRLESIELAADNGPAEMDDCVANHQFQTESISRDGKHAVAMRSLLDAPWVTVAFVLDRPNSSATRKLLGRARQRMQRSPSWDPEEA